MTTTAKIASKGTKGTGLTEEIAATLHDNLGKTIVAIVEITSETRSENRKGDETVGLSIGTIEIAPEGMAADHVRELARAFHYERKLAGPDDQLRIETGDDIEPKVKDVLAAGAQHTPHQYVDTAEAICDVCGQSGLASIHEILTDDDPEDLDNEEPDDAEADADQTGQDAEPPAHEPIGSPFATTGA